MFLVEQDDDLGLICMGEESTRVVFDLMNWGLSQERTAMNICGSGIDSVDL